MSTRALNAALAAGFLAVTVGVVVARYSPATGYEVSIYAGTPTATWIALGLALAIATVGAIAFRGAHQGAAIALGGFAVTSIVSLPIVRGYRFQGMGDALTHLGWVRDIVGGDMLPHELFYPGLHGIASLVHLLGGASTEHALWLGVVVLFVPFVIFLPLIVRDVTGDAAAVGIAGIVTWFLLPINNVATYVGAHSTSNALFFVPVVLFALVAYLRRDTSFERLPLGISPFSALLVLTGIALLLVHPQQMINVVVLLVAFSAIQFLARRRYEYHPIHDHAGTAGHAFVLGGCALVWSLSNERFRDALVGLGYGLVSGSVGGGATVDQRGASLAELGGSVGELFAKLFLAGTVVALVAGLFVLLVWRGRTSADGETRSFVAYCVAALVPLGGMFAIYFVGTPTMAFRQVGFIFVILSILGAVALGHGLGWLQGTITRPGANAVVASVLGVCLVLSVLTVFSSPFIYNPTQHVSDQQYSGYETALENRGEQPYAGMGYTALRYDDAINGVEGDNVGGSTAITGAGEGTVDPEAFNDGDYGGAYPAEEYYFVVSAYDTEREFGVYDELNHERAALDGVEHQPGINRVLSNDEFTLYDVNGGA